MKGIKYPSTSGYETKEKHCDILSLPCFIIISKAIIRNNNVGTIVSKPQRG